MGVLCEAALLVLALGWGVMFRESPGAQLAWSPGAAALGTLAALPLLLVFAWTLRSKLGILTRHRAMLDSIIPGLLGGWRVWQLGAISLCAGICEEALFRGAMQASLAARIGLPASLILVSLLFGAAHFVSWTYGILATLMGIYLGLLFAWSGNLLTPIVAHAVYDFLALLYYLKVPWREP